MKLDFLLREAVSSVQSLREYYVNQIDLVNNNVKNESEYYKYGIVLEKFFWSKIYEDSDWMLDEEEQQLLDEVLDTYEIESNDNGESNTVQYRLKENNTLSKKYELNPKKATNSVIRLMDRPHILNDSTLIMLLIRYEEIISGIWKYLIAKFPNAYLKDKSITYAELIGMNDNVSGIKNRFIEKEVEEIMRQPISDWYDLYVSKHGARFDFGQEFEQFKEIYYRRNLIVHNQGVVNEIYLSNVKTTLECGEKVRTNKAYLINAFDITYMLIYGTIYGLVKVSEDKERLLDSLFEIGFKHMVDAEWKLSEYIYCRLMSEKEQSDADKWCNTVNYWISVKNQGRMEEIQADIEKFDVSARDGQFKVAKAALLDDYIKVSNILEREINNGIAVSYIEEWPLFIQYRESEEYIAFKREHSEMFEIQGYKPEHSNSEISDDNIVEEFGENMEMI